MRKTAFYAVFENYLTFSFSRVERCKVNFNLAGNDVINHSFPHDICVLAETSRFPINVNVELIAETCKAAKASLN